jgi:putative membrane protein
MLKKSIKLPWVLACILIMMLLWSKYRCAQELIWWLEALPVLIVLPILSITYNKFRFTNLSYFLIFIHAIVLLIGAHYTYEKVPLFDYFKEFCNFSRNHYDRLGHFAQGFVPAIIARELLLRTSTIRRGKWLVAIITLSILGISALYEILEWITAVITGEAASAFLATQGDVWDTQKDMALAGIGAIVALITLSKLHDGMLRNQNQNSTVRMTKD